MTKNKEEKNLDFDETIQQEEELIVEENEANALKKAKEKIKNLEEEKKQYLDGWQRSQADMINMKKTHEEQKKMFTQIGKESLLLEMVPVLDNFEAAFLDKSWADMPQNWKTGIEYIYKQFLQILKEHDIEIFGKIGEEFDISLHHSIENQEVGNEEEDGKVVMVVQKGYKIKDKIIREAKVKVGLFTNK